MQSGVGVMDCASEDFPSARQYIEIEQGVVSVARFGSYVFMATGCTMEILRRLNLTQNDGIVF